MYLSVVFNLPLNQSFTYRTMEGETGLLLGKRVEVYLGNRRTTGFVIAESESLDEGCAIDPKNIKEIRRIIDKEAVFGPDHIDLARWISSFYLCSVGEALSAIIPSGRRETGGVPVGIDDSDFSPVRHALSEEQIAAIDTITGESRPKSVYLWGVTGSGKTEVFLQAAEHILNQGKDILYLVPEIALTHQVVEAVVNRFGTQAAVLHSGLSGSKKLGEWMRILRGDARIVIGARSAVFAPVKNLGLIIIDEEHDGSYKSGTTPRYHARTVAMRRATVTGATLVMGSATPSLEAWYQIRSGALVSCRLTKRLAGGAEPRLSVVDLSNSNGPLSPELIEAIRTAKQSGRQTILFLNRRGFTHFYRCKTCGYELMCKNCSVPLTLHRSISVMKCHYCGWQVPPPGSCPSCGSLDTAYAGFGTEFVEEEVRKTFPDYTIVRIDTDSMSEAGKDGVKDTIEHFREGTTDILLGTQMVAKGLNFPGVRLVGIALADTGLHMPDFRAAERTFSLITQVAGRAGRFFPDGEVIIQTWNPKSPAIEYARRGDIEGFYTHELSQRAELGFPPFSRLLRLVFRSKDKKIAEESASAAAALLQPLLGEQDILLGPSECPLSIISGNFRHQLILKGEKLSTLIAAVRSFRDGYKSPANLYTEIDVDPQSLL
ncbi:MAG: primosomal protein N' [Spirochaetales bacterium]|nr:primosomal protein N' [Spirochaetales bacterium]